MSTTLGRDCQNYKAKIYQWINQAIGGIKEVKILETEDFFTNSFSSYYVKYSNALCILHLLAMVPKYIVEAVCMTGLLLAIIFKLLWGQADMIYFVPQLTVFAVAAFRLMPSVGRINGYVSQMMSDLPSVNLVYHDLQEVDDYQKKRSEEKREDWKFRKSISVENVTFHYPGTERRVIDSVNFTIPRGKMAAFIGASGAGKTTMVDLILGLLTPDSGRICADGMDVHRNPVTWHREIGYIPQTIYLADESIRENIAFGIDPDKIDDEAVSRAVRQAQLEEYISSLPDGVNTMVGDRGVRISGGQRQRIGIARALYHNPEILVLDEATSALDSETETAVMGAINSLQGVKTLIVIAHRLTTIRNADLFFRVEDGKVVPQTAEEVFQ
jgi:ABC-type multidrug transport system fused ATPase/permease subunit